MARRGQASLEMTAAMIGALLILFASMKICVWVAERLVTRNQVYENTRLAGGSKTRVIPPLPFLPELNETTTPKPVWDPKLDKPSKPLRIFSQ